MSKHTLGPWVYKPTSARGMTLRDYFAGQAMDGYNKCIMDYGWGEEILFEHAKQAYAIADAMLKARAQ